MTTGDEEAENLVDNLFREVDDQFKDLEREYHQAREDLAVADLERRGATEDPLEASTERFALMAHVASLQAEVSRQAGELDERDRLLAELSDRITDFESDSSSRDQLQQAVHLAEQAATQARREQARLSALLDARAAEREELADVTQRLQNERDHVQELLATALARFDEVEETRIDLDDKLRHLEAARDTAAREHDARAHELIESRAEMSKLIERVAELEKAFEEAEQGAEKADALAERRANEANYLTRRIEAMTEKAHSADHLGREVNDLRKQLLLKDRHITELERAVADQTAEASAATAAVDAIAERSSGYDELLERIAELEQERDEALKAVAGRTGDQRSPETEVPAVDVETTSEAEAEPAMSVSELAGRARELGTRRAGAAPTRVAKPQWAEPQLERAGPERPPLTAAGSPNRTEALEALDADEQQVIDVDLTGFSGPQPGAEPAPGQRSEADSASQPAATAVEAAPFGGLPHKVPRIVPPQIHRPQSTPARPAATTTPGRDGSLKSDGFGQPNPASATSSSEIQMLDDTQVLDLTGLLRAGPPHVRPASERAAPNSGAVADPASAPDQQDRESAPVGHRLPEDLPAEDAPTTDLVIDGGQRETVIGLQGQGSPRRASAPTAPQRTQPTAVSLTDLSGEPEASTRDEPGQHSGPPPAESEPQSLTPPSTSGEEIELAAVARRRMVLPAKLAPNTPDAVAYLLQRPSVVAIVDARSTCGRTGVRPSDLFARLGVLRDRFSVPIEVVLTPVSTPVGGIPDLANIGVHQVTGSDTVADRVRALCMGFPADQALVVIAGDSHVRRAAIGEEANVLDPAVVLDLAKD